MPNKKIPRTMTVSGFFWAPYLPSGNMGRIALELNVVGYCPAMLCSFFASLRKRI